MEDPQSTTQRDGYGVLVVRPYLPFAGIFAFLGCAQCAGLSYDGACYNNCYTPCETTCFNNLMTCIGACGGSGPCIDACVATYDACVADCCESCKRSCQNAFSGDDLNLKFYVPRNIAIAGGEIIVTALAISTPGNSEYCSDNFECFDPLTGKAQGISVAVNGHSIDTILNGPLNPANTQQQVEYKASGFSRYVKNGENTLVVSATESCPTIEQVRAGKVNVDIILYYRFTGSL